jgi:hypothetical protein
MISTEAEEREELTKWAHNRSLKKAPRRRHRWCSQGCGSTSTTVQLATASRSSGMAMVKRPLPARHRITASGRRRGCRHCHPTGDGDRDPVGRCRGEGAVGQAGPALVKQDGSELDWVEMNGVEEDERRQGKRIPTVKRKSTRRQIRGPTRQRRKPPKLVGGARWSWRRRVVARERGG